MKNNLAVNAMINKVIAVEGGYVDHPDDPGGATNFGITEAVARQFGYAGSMRDLPIQIAESIYRNQYYIRPNYAQVNEISQLIAMELVDTAVNCGISRASKWLQQSLSKLNRQQTLFLDLKQDGMIGQKTIEALDVVRDDEAVLLKMLDCLQGHHYLSLGDWSEAFVRGWFHHRVARLGVSGTGLFLTKH